MKYTLTNGTTLFILNQHSRLVAVNPSTDFPIHITILYKRYLLQIVVLHNYYKNS